MNERELIEKYTEKYCKYQNSGNNFVDLDPISKLNIFILLALSSFIAQGFHYGMLLCLFYCLLAAYCGKFIGFIKLFSRLALLIVGILILVRQLTIQGDTILFSIFGWRWTQEALEMGLNTGFALLSFSGAIVLFYLITSMRDLMYSLEQRGVSHSASYIVLASFQTITDLNATAQTILESQKARGIKTEGFNRWRAFLPVLGPLILSAISSSEEKFIAMDARAFSVSRKHTFLNELRPVPVWEKTVVVAANVIFIAVVAIKLYMIFGGQ